jgi:hypothetical protein
VHGHPCFLGVLDHREDDVTIELPISTLSRILKVTQFHKRRMCGREKEKLTPHPDIDGVHLL